MISKLDSMTEALRLIPQHVDLWDWPLDEGNNRANLRDLISECRVPSNAVASIFKMLHLKRPQLIPVIDDWTRQAWNESYSRKWTFDELVEIMSRMSRELGARREGLEELQTVAQDLGWPFNSLSRLRLYDVAFYGHEIETREDSG